MAKYRLLGKLAKGGMAEVILAEAVGREGFKKKLVLKRILPHLADDPEFVQMFLQEARLAAQLTHPNIAQIFDLGQFGDLPFISMEHVDGRNLRQVLGRATKLGQRLPTDVVVKIAAHACDALAYAHELVGEAGPLNLIHRDVSPENIMISKGGVVKLVDFGIAKASTTSTKTQGGAVRGKSSYLAPEQALGKPLDGRTDQFALSVVLYECLSGGQKPFRKVKPLELMRAIVYEPHVPLREAQPEVPEALAAIIDRGLAKSPDDRWPSCRVLAGELERFLVQKGSYVPASAIAEAVKQVFAGEPDPQPAPVPPEELDGEIMWTDAVPALGKAPGSGPAANTPVAADDAAASGAPPSSAPVATPAAPEPARESGQPQQGDAAPGAGAADVPADGGAVSVDVPDAGPIAEAAADGRPGAGRKRLFVGLGAAALIAAVATAALLSRAKPAPATAAPSVVTAQAPVVAQEVRQPAPVPAASAATAEPGNALPAKIEPAAAPAPTTGALNVESSAGGDVFVDGELRGEAPLLVEALAPGSHEVEVRLASLGTRRKVSVKVAAGETANYEAVFGKGALVVRARPFADVTVDGKKYGVTPLKPIRLVEGVHRVEMVYDGAGKRQTRVKTVRIKARAETKVIEVFE